MAGVTVCVLGVVRCVNPAVVGETVGVSSVPLDSSVQAVVPDSKKESIEVVRKTGVAYTLFHTGFQRSGRSAIEE